MKKLYLVLYALLSSSAFAAPITTDVLVDVDLSFGLDSFAVEGQGTQGGMLEIVTGGAAQTIEISDMSATPSDAIGDSFTDTNDQALLFGAVSGAFDEEGQESFLADGFYLDFSVDMSNTSIADSYEIVLGFMYMQMISAEETSFDNFADSEIDIFDSNGNTLWFSNLESDSMFGNFGDDAELPGAGGELFEEGSFELTFLLSPGENDFINGQLVLSGGAFAPDGIVENFTALQFSVLEVNNVTSNLPVPEPGMLFIMASGLGLIASRQFRRA